MVVWGGGISNSGNHTNVSRLSQPLLTITRAVKRIIEVNKLNISRGILQKSVLSCSSESGNPHPAPEFSVFIAT